MPDQVRHDDQGDLHYSVGVRLLLLSLSGSLIACTAQPETPSIPNQQVNETTHACVQRLRDWPYNEPRQIGIGIGGLDFHQLEVTANGALRWNREDVSWQEISGRLLATNSLRPPIPVVLLTSTRSNCLAAERVRTLMDSVCRPDGCFEQSRWVTLGYPDYEQYYAPDGSRRRHR